MKTTILTYRDKTLVLIEKPQFYFLRNKKDFDEMIDDLINIDAVSSPCNLEFPAILELQRGASVTLKQVKWTRVYQVLKETQEICNEAKKELVNW